MISKIKSVSLLTLLIITATLLSVAITNAQGDGFFEPFDDPSLPGWEMVGKSYVQDGHLVMESGSGALPIREWSDYELHTLLRRMGDGEIVFHLRFTDEGTLSLLIGGGYAALLSGPQLLAESPIEEIPDQEWFAVHAIAMGDRIEVNINGQPVITTDMDLGDAPAQGTLGFFYEGPGSGEVDFVEIFSLGGEPPQPEPEPTQASAEETPVQSKTSNNDFTTESVIVMYEDMRNGMFDAAIPIGPGTLTVENAGDDNLAAHISGDLDVEMHPAAWQSFSWINNDLSLRIKRSEDGSIGFGIRWIPWIPHANADTDRGYWIDHDGTSWILTKVDHSNIEQLGRFDGSFFPNSWHDLMISTRNMPDGGSEFSVLLDDVEAFRFTDPTPIPFGTLAFRTKGSNTEMWLDDIQVTEHLSPSRTWRQSHGPEGVSSMTAIAVDPRDWRVAYTGGTDAGLFKTLDGGQTWEEIGLAHDVWTPRIQTIVHAPSDPNIMYLGAGGKHISPLWRSNDGGETWQWMRPVGEGGEFIREADTMAVAVMPDDPMHIYFGIGSGIGIVPAEVAGVYESRDGGRTYENLHSGGGSIGPIVIDPMDPQHILAGSLNVVESGVSVITSYDGGLTWTASDEGILQDDIRQLIFDPSTPDTVFAVAHTVIPEEGGNLYRSKDSGKTWEILSSLPKSNGLLYNPLPTPTMFANQPDGFFVSTDSGDSWSRFSDRSCVGDISAIGINDPNVIYGITPPSINVSKDRGLTCTKSTEGLLAHPVIGLGTSESNPAVVYIGTGMGVFKSTDAGETWKYLLPGLWAGIAVDPTNSEIVYIGNVERADVLKSTDGGETWTNLEAEIHYPGVSTLVVDPNDPQVIYAGTGHGPQMPPQGAGLYKSTDGGESWLRLVGVPDVAVTAVEIDRGGSGRIAVATMGNGVLVSEDSGLTFESRNNGFVDDPVARQVWALRIHPENPDILYAGTSLHYGKVGSGGYDGLYKTTDGGRNWTMLLGGEAVPVSPNSFIAMGGGVDAISINPARPDEVYVALHDPGIAFSDDGGDTWNYVNSGLVPLMTHVYPYRMDISPSGDILYVTSCGRSIFRNLTSMPEDSITEFLTTLPSGGVADKSEPQPEPTEEIASRDEPEATPSEGGFRLPCPGAVLPALALALTFRRRRKR